MRLVFFGSPDFAVPALRLLAGHHEIALVVTQPDRPKGRGRKSAPTPVKVVAQELGLQVTAPSRIKRGAFPELLESLGADYFVVVAYGRILTPRILAAPKNGSLNIHPSRLPLYRGPAPVNWVLINGDEQTAITIMEINDEMDAGDIIVQEETPIGAEESAGGLLDRCARRGAVLLNELLLEEERRGEKLPRKRQNHAMATYAPFLTTALAKIDWDKPAGLVAGHIRGLDPRPGAYTHSGETRIKVFSPRVTLDGGAPGEVLGVDEHGLVIACAENAVSLGELQFPSKRRLPAKAALTGYHLPSGARLE